LAVSQIDASQPNVLNRAAVGVRTSGSPVDMDKVTATVMAEVEKKMGKKVEEMEKEIAKLKTTVSDYEQRIKTLEGVK
jgi:tetrahydromethanopterin S-methyltransferase subunit B